MKKYVQKNKKTGKYLHYSVFLNGMVKDCVNLSDATLFFSDTYVINKNYKIVNYIDELRKLKLQKLNENR